MHNTSASCAIPVPGRSGRSLLALLSGGGLLVLGCRGTDTTRVWIDAGRDASPDGVEAVVSPVSDDAGAPPIDAAFAGACGVGRPATYAFESRFVVGQSSVSYASAVGARALITSVRGFVESLSDRIDAGTSYAEGELVSQFEELLASPVASLSLDDWVPAAAGALLEGEPADFAMEGGLSATLAGSRPETEFRPWAEPGTFRGFSDFDLGRGHPEGFTPQTLLRALAEELEINARNRTLGFLLRAPDATTLPVHITRDGRDLSELMGQILHAAVVFSGVTDDLLDDATPGRGLLSSRQRWEGSAYSPLEHVWDLAFGHYGAARDHDRYTAEEVAGVGGRRDRGQGFFDTNADCRVSLLSEVNQGDAVLAAQRDHEAVGLTDLGGQAFRALLAARRLAAGGEPGAEQSRELARLGGAAGAAGEGALAAAALHDRGRGRGVLERAGAGREG
jgi:hypothetical protein